MYEINVGDVIEKFRIRTDKTLFDYTDEGCSLIVLFQSPDEREISQFKSGNSFEIRFVELNGVIMLTVKIGNLEWMDAPYTPHLSKDLTKLEIPNKGEGLALTVFLVDSDTGEVKHIRLLGLSEDFSKKFIGCTLENKMKPFNENEYNQKVQQIYRKYSTKDIVKLSKDRCKM